MPVFIDFKDLMDDFYDELTSMRVSELGVSVRVKNAILRGMWKYCRGMEADDILLAHVVIVINRIGKDAFYAGVRGMGQKAIKEFEQCLSWDMFKIKHPELFY